jgi:hypothetical protein
MPPRLARPDILRVRCRQQQPDFLAEDPDSSKQRPVFEQRHEQPGSRDRGSAQRIGAMGVDLRKIDIVDESLTMLDCVQRRRAARNSSLEATAISPSFTAAGGSRQRVIPSLPMM